MKTKKIRHLTHYVVLLTLMIIGIITISAVENNPLTQAFIILLLSFSFVIWGLVHHLLEKDFYFEVFLEYLLFALLGSVAAIALIFYL